MSWLLWLAGIALGLWVLIIVIVALRAARRLDRIHKQIARARARLGELLIRRAQAAQSLTDYLDPASALILDTGVREVLHAEHSIAPDPLTGGTIDPAGLARRWQAESDLSQILRTVIAAQAQSQIVTLPGGEEALRDCLEISRMVQMSRSFHNTHVTAALALRRRHHWLGRAVVGRTRPVQIIDFDDEVAPG